MTTPTPQDIQASLADTLNDGVAQKQLADRNVRFIDPNTIYDLSKKIEADQINTNGPFLKVRFRNRHF